jgi:hypothetical protein
MRFPALALFGILSGCLSPVGFGQSLASIGFTPTTLAVGSGPVQLSIYCSGVILPPDAILLWNGVQRSALVTPSSQIAETFQVNLTGQDLALSGLARVTVIDPETGAALAESFIAIGYNLVPQGLVYDSTRSRFYVVPTELCHRVQSGYRNTWAQLHGYNFSRASSSFH